jgi:Flp pilus assembly pilin Flp
MEARFGRWADIGIRGCQTLTTCRAGVTSIEYALLASLVAVAILGGVNGYAGGLGNLMSSTFSKITGAL